MSAIALALAVLGAPRVAQADGISWYNTNTGDWSNNANWCCSGRPPTAGDTASIYGPGAVATVSGTVTVDGVYVAAPPSSQGSLFVTGTLTSGVASLANSAGAVGTATVSGTGQWINTGDLYVGNLGTGTLNVNDSASVTVGTLYVGGSVGTLGNAAVGSGASLATSGTLFVGYGGSGTLDSLGTLTTQGAVLGDGVGSNGTSTIRGGTWTNGGNLTVGRAGSGSLGISGGAQVSNAVGVIGAGANGTASSVTVSDTGSRWSNSDQLFIGIVGSGSLTVSGGASVDSVGAVIGRQATSDSTATVTGSGSQWSTGALLIGGDRIDPGSNGGTGTLHIDNGARVESTTAMLGDVGTAHGTAIVEGGATWQLSDRLTVGNLATGTLSITGGGVVNATGGLVGREAGSTGSVTISGAGSAWNNSGHVFIGNVGNGTLSVSNGGSLRSVDGYVGTEAGSTSSATLTGAGSTWVNSGDFFIGHNTGAAGTVTVTDGATLRSVQGILGDLAGSRGTLRVSGAGASVTTSGDFNVGRFGQGELRVESGATLNAGRGLIGNEAGSTGTAVVSGAGSTWRNSGKLTVGASGEGSLTVGNGGTVAASEIAIAQSAGSVGVLNIGAAEGAAAEAAGTVDAGSIRFGAGTGKLVVNTNDTTTLAASLSGSGAIAKLGSGLLRYTGDGSAFSGQTTLSTGTLSVNGRLGGALTVASGATLQGIGTVGNTTLLAGATVAPGNSIGTLNVAGDFTFSAGSRYVVEADAAGNSDRIAATGSITLNSASLVVVTADGNWNPSTTYTILTSGKGVVGSFGDVSTNFAFLQPTLNFGADGNVVLTLPRNSTAFPTVAVTRNQKSTAGAVEALGAGTLYNAVVQLDAPTARNAFDRLSGELYASWKGAVMQNSRLVRDAGIDRLRQATDSVAAPTDLASRGGVEGATWGRAYGAWGDDSSDGNAARTDRQSGGVIIGADTRVGPDWRVGVMGGASQSRLNLDDRAASARSDDYQVGLYGGRRWGALSLRTGAAYGWSDADTQRSIDFTGFSDTATADRRAKTAQAFAELGWRFDLPQASLEPFANLAHVNVRSEAFVERSGAAALHGASENDDITFGTLGMRGSTLLALGAADATLHGTLGWRHASGDRTPSAKLAFVGGSGFAVAGAPLARDAAVVEASVDIRLQRQLTLGVSYGAQLGDGLREHSVRAHVAWTF
ncbi:autotransporter domain-containing protein [Variovorax sp. N23]|uniref:autotransporter domain-containing protein n=1 Tax=Variovorax sp. N23 TaxID=2980555 RepID=UPI0021C78AA7|nr:autotransporter domain-containing protein [Variovorax sp. N23]MCU4121174.1 autotransporter domain-containing protein [Variovorax sp. N23]